MGFEIVIAALALALALIGLNRTKVLAERAQATATALQNDQRALTAELSERLQMIGERFGVAGPPTDSVKQLAATVKVFELRMLEHDALLCSLVSEDEARHLWNVSKDQVTLYELHPGVESELRSLVRRGLLKKQGDFMIHELPHDFDLHDRFALTETGEMLLALRKHLKSADARPKHSMPPAAPESGTMRNAPPPFVRPTGS